MSGNGISMTTHNFTLNCDYGSLKTPQEDYYQNRDKNMLINTKTYSNNNINNTILWYTCGYYI